MIISQYAGLPRPVYVLFATRIVNRLGDFVRIFLTIYLTRYLGYDETRAGFVVTLSALASLLGTLAGGKAGDMFPRKTAMLSAQCLSAVTIGVCGWMPDNPAVPLLLVVSQFFFGFVRPINGAMVIDLTPAEMRQKAYSLLYLGINIGVAVGPLLAGILFNRHRRWIFWGDGLTTLAAVLLVLFFVPTPENPEIGTSRHEQVEEGSSFRALLRRPDLSIFMVLTVLYSIIYSQHSFALPLQLESLFGSKGARYFGFLMSFNAVIVLVFTPLLLHFLGKRRPLTNYRAGALLNAAGFAMLFLHRPFFPLFLASVFVFTLGEIITVTNEGIFVAELTPVNHRGRFNAIRNAARTAGVSVSPVLGGVLLQDTGFSAFWLAMGAVGALQLVGLAFLERRMVSRR